MHNNGHINIERSNRKESYTVMEAAILWARGEGAKNASDPRIGEYRTILNKAIEAGQLTQTDGTLNPAELKSWMTDHRPGSKPAFLFTK